MSLLLYSCTMHFHRKHCHIRSTRWTMLYEWDSCSVFPVGLIFQNTVLCLIYRATSKSHLENSCFFLDRICFYGASKKCQKTSQTLMDACMLATLWETGMQCAFSIVCSIETCLLYFRWSFWWQVQGRVFLHNAVAAFFVCTFFSSQRYSGTHRLSQISHILTIIKVAFVINERSAVKNSVHKQ